MFGIDDVYVWLAFVLCVLSTILCIVYGIIRWNKGSEDVEPDDVKWVEHEKEVEEEL